MGIGKILAISLGTIASIGAIGGISAAVIVNKQKTTQTIEVKEEKTTEVKLEEKQETKPEENKANKDKFAWAAAANDSKKIGW